MPPRKSARLRAKEVPTAEELPPTRKPRQRRRVADAEAKAPSTRKSRNTTTSSALRSSTKRTADQHDEGGDAVPKRRKTRAASAKARHDVGLEEVISATNATLDAAMKGREDGEEGQQEAEGEDERGDEDDQGEGQEGSDMSVGGSDIEAEVEQPRPRQRGRPRKDKADGDGEQIGPRSRRNPGADQRDHESLGHTSQAVRRSRRGTKPAHGNDGDQDQQAAEASKRAKTSQRRGSRRASGRGGSAVHFDGQAEDEAHDSRPGTSGEAGPEAALEAAPETAEGTSTTILKTGRLISLINLMGKPGWRNTKEWQEYFDDVRDLPGPRSVPGRKIWQLLYDLDSLLCEAPRPVLPNEGDYDRWHQHRFLLDNAPTLENLYSAILAKVRGICEKRLGGNTEHPGNADPSLRKEMMRDITSFIIPKLVVVLKHAFMLGGCSEDVGVPSPLAEVELTRSIVDILARVVGWISRLEGAVTSEIVYSSEASRSRSFPTGPKHDFTNKRRAGKEEERKQSEEDRLRLKPLVDKMKWEISEAMRKLAGLDQSERRRQGRVTSEAALEKEKQHREEEEETRRRQFQACRASIQAMRGLPHPFDEIRKRVNSHYAKEDRHQLASPRKKGGGVHYVNDALAPYEPLPFRDEESDIVLNALRQTANLDLSRVARTLDREYDEVVQHAEQLKRAMREMVQQRKLGKPPAWAKA